LKYLLIDGNPICHRAYHVFNLSTADKVPTGVLFGSISILKSLLESLDYDDVVICWDKGKRLRRELYPAYKHKVFTPPAEGEEPYFRPEEFFPQVELLQDFLHDVGAKQFMIEGVEADDLLGIISQDLRDMGHTVMIATIDSDMQQLIDGKDVTVYDTKKKQVLDEAWFLQTYGVEPIKLIDIKALTGDGSDNIPGIKGVGIKTALKMVRGFDGIDNLYESGLPDKADKRTRSVYENFQRVMFNKSLIKIFRLPEELGEEQSEYLKQWFLNFKGDPHIDKVAARALLEHWEIQKFADGELLEWFANCFADEDPKMRKVRDAQVLDEELSSCICCRAITVQSEEPISLINSEPVPAVGKVRTDWMIIGRNPGEEEDRDGEPFIGKAGKRLNKMIEDIGQTRDDFWITNVVKCYSPGNRPPILEEIENCTKFLQREIDLIQPKLIVTCGKEAFESVVGVRDGFLKNAGAVIDGKDCHGRVKVPSSCLVIVFNHPSHALRSPQGEETFKICTSVLRRIIQGLESS